MQRFINRGEPNYASVKQNQEFKAMKDLNAL